MTDVDTLQADIETPTPAKTFVGEMTGSVYPAADHELTDDEIEALYGGQIAAAVKHWTQTDTSGLEAIAINARYVAATGRKLTTKSVRAIVLGNTPVDRQRTTANGILARLAAAESEKEQETQTS